MLVFVVVLCYIDVGVCSVVSTESGVNEGISVVTGVNADACIDDDGVLILMLILVLSARMGVVCIAF